MENILYDFNENVIRLIVDFLKNSILEAGLSNFNDDLNDKLMKLGYDLTRVYVLTLLCKCIILNMYT